MFRSLFFLTYLFLLNSNPLSAQLNNAIFNGSSHPINSSLTQTGTNPMALKNAPNVWGVQALHYFKNNEYMEAHNPGQTFFGVQLTTGRTWYLNQDQTKLNVGAMLNVPFGGINQTKVYPLIQFQHAFSNAHQLVLGSLHGNTRHQLYEPLYNYELALTQSLEYGVQYRYQQNRFESDLWLDWRQTAQSQISQQEIISFGWNARLKLHNEPFKIHQISIPMSSLVYHQGGESLSVGKPIQNKWNGSVGLRYDYKNRLRFESIVFGSQDFSPQLQTSFKDGHAWYNQIHCNLNPRHNWVLSHYYAEEFHAPFGPNLFLSEQLGNPFAFVNYRNFIMARYQWMGVIIPETCIFDFRIEPIWHIEKQQFAFSAGFYLKYVIGTELY